MVTNNLKEYNVSLAAIRTRLEILKTDLQIWYKRLGYPGLEVLERVSS